MVTMLNREPASVGRPPGPANSLEEIFNAYVRYRRRLRRERSSRITRAGFWRDEMKRSETWLRGYERKHNLAFPFWPEDGLLVFVVWDHPPYFDLTWANPAVFEATGYAWNEVLDDHGDFVRYESPLCDMNVFTDLDPSRTSPEHPSLLAELRADPTRVGTIERTFLVHSTNGTRIPIEVVELRWTGPLERWLIIARVLDEPDGKALHDEANGKATVRGKLSKREREDLYNVDQHTILRLTSQPSTLVLGGDTPAPIQIVPPQTNLVINGGGRLTPMLPIDTHPSIRLEPMPTITVTGNWTPDLVKDLMNQYLPPYRPPDKTEGKEQ